MIAGVKQRYLILFASLFLSMFFAVASARAFFLTPEKMVVTAAPGTSQVLTIKIKNDATDAALFRLAVREIKQDEAGRPLMGAVQSATESWLRPETTAVQLTRGEDRTVRFILAVPNSAAPGARYLGLSVRQERKASAGPVGISGELDVILNLQVAGAVTETAALNEWRSQSNIYWNNVWKFQVQIENTSAVAIPLLGRLIVRDRRDQPLMDVPVSLGSDLLPQSRRTLKPIVIMTNNTIRWPGSYYAELRLNYGKTQQKLVSTVRIWYFPTSLLVTAGLLVGLAATFILAVRKRMQEKRYGN